MSIVFSWIQKAMHELWMDIFYTHPGKISDTFLQWPMDQTPFSFSNAMIQNINNELQQSYLQKLAERVQVFNISNEHAIEN